MRKFFSRLHLIYFLLVVIYLTTVLFAFNQAVQLKQKQDYVVKTFYSKSESIPVHIIDLVQGSKNYIFLAMYTLTHEDLTNALVSAKLRGLDVKVLLDYKQSLIDESKPQISKLRKYNIDVRIPFRTSGIMHLKTLVTDQGYASGSFNWTNSAASYNDEVIEIGNIKSVHNSYLNIFNKLWQESNLD